MMIDSRPGGATEISPQRQEFHPVLSDGTGWTRKTFAKNGRKNAIVSCHRRVHQRVGRGGGLGRGLGVEVGLGVGIGLGVTVGEAVGVGVGDGSVSYSSALARTLLEPSPAATSTMPLDNNVAVCLSRAALRLPVTVQLPFAGSYNSALAKTPVLPTPAATSAVPFGSNVAV